MSYGGADYAGGPYAGAALDGVILPPVITSLTPGASTATMTWNASDDATGYEVRVDGGSSVDVGNVLSYEFTGLTVSTLHTFEVRAYDADRESLWSSITATTLDHFEVRIDGGTPVATTDLCELFSGLDPHTLHDLEVRACNETCCSEWALIEGLTCPDPPTGLTIGTVTRTTVEVCWNATGPPAATYDVAVGDEDPVTGLTDLCYLFDGLTAGTSYTFAVRVCDENDCCSGYATLTVSTSPGIAWSPCQCNPRWMVESCDLASGRVRAILNPLGIDIQTLLNQPGGGTLTLSTQDTAARDVWPDLTSIYISRLTDTGIPEVQFAGYVEAFDGRSSLDGGTVSVGLKGITNYLFRRRLRQMLTYASAPQTSIAASLVNYTLTNGIPLTAVADASVILRDRTYDPAERPKIGDLLTDLFKVIDGPEYVLLHTKTNGFWATEMFIQDRAGSDRIDILHSDVEGYTYGLKVDAIDHANSADALNGAGLIGTSTTLGPYPQFDTAETYDSTVLQSTLDQQAAGIVKFRGEPYAFPFFGIAGPDPKPENLRLGDSAIFHITQAAVTFNGRARVGGITWKVTEGAPENRILALLPTEPTSQTVLNQTAEERCVSCR